MIENQWATIIAAKSLDYLDIKKGENIWYRNSAWLYIAIFSQGLGAALSFTISSFNIVRSWAVRTSLSGLDGNARKLLAKAYIWLICLWLLKSRLQYQFRNRRFSSFQSSWRSNHFETQLFWTLPFVWWDVWAKKSLWQKVYLPSYIHYYITITYYYITYHIFPTAKTVHIGGFISFPLALMKRTGCWSFLHFDVFRVKMWSLVIFLVFFSSENCFLKSNQALTANWGYRQQHKCPRLAGSIDPWDL